MLIYRRNVFCIMFRLRSSSSRKCSSATDDDYRKAISALNDLQSSKQDPKMVQYPSQKLSSVFQYLARSGIELQNLEKKLSVIHVSGTKGKGSTCAYCESILRHYGYKTGFFSSPHLCSVRERIRINGTPLSKRKFADYFWNVYKNLEQNKDANTDLSSPTYFVFLTLMAFNVFLKEKVDIAIIEVGIGGEYDSTNILKNTAVVGISSLGFDHVDILGNSIEEIAWQKAGIIKPGSIVITAANQPETALHVLQKRATKKNCTIYIAPDLSEYKFNGEIELGIDGPVQRLNASLALQLVNAWMNPRQYSQKNQIQQAPTFTLCKEMLEGLRKCSWLGRTQVFQYSSRLNYYLDGAHTDESIQYCLKWYTRLTSSSMDQKALVFNMIGNRDTRKLLGLFLPYQFDLVCFCTNKIRNLADSLDNSSDNWSHPSTEEDKRAVQNYNHWLELNPTADKRNIRLLSSVCEVHELMENLSREKKVHVLVTGSLHLVGSFLSLLTTNNED